MKTSHLLRLAAVLLLTGCAGGVQPRPAPTAPPPTPLPTIPAGVHPGFDLSLYPGEDALRSWREASPYRWVGYYLTSSCHRDASWSGTRETLERLGWGVAVLYVGQQVFEADTVAGSATGGPVLCSRTLLTAEQGAADARDAVAKARAEGFAPGSVVFLDVERTSRVPDEMAGYYRAWIGELLRDGTYRPGTYAHRANVGELLPLARAAHAEAGNAGEPSFWVAGGDNFSLARSPGMSGWPAADVWQGAHDVDRAWGGVTLRIDENVADRPSPSAPEER